MEFGPSRSGIRRPEVLLGGEAHEWPRRPNGTAQRLGRLARARSREMTCHARCQRKSPFETLGTARNTSTRQEHNPPALQLPLRLLREEENGAQGCAD